MESSCLICGAEVEHWPGAPRCDVCRAIPVEMLERHGFELDVETHHQNNGGVTYYVTSPQTVTSQLAVVLSEENLGRKVQKLFSDELEIGDDAFDRKVFVHYAEAEDVEAFRDPWVQELVIGLVKLGKLTITENHSNVLIRSITTITADEVYARLGMVIAALDRVRRA